MSQILQRHARVKQATSGHNRRRNTSGRDLERRTTSNLFGDLNHVCCYFVMPSGLSESGGKVRSKTVIFRVLR
jgi:hypothetical protein